jgi:hypothetical protein
VGKAACICRSRSPKKPATCFILFPLQIFKFVEHFVVLPTSFIDVFSWVLGRFSVNIFTKADVDVDKKSSTKID